jgi:phosphate transport system substrate-binding protein
MRLNCRLALGVAFAAVLLATMAGPVMAGELRISGAATIARGIILPNQAAIEQETGLTLVIVVNGDGNGLKDLYAGRADVAMAVAPLAVTEAMLNKASPGSLSTAGFQSATVGSSTIHFVVNPANPVKSLSAAQLRDIFTGKITTWKEVGGDDQPILVIAEVIGLGVHTNVVAGFLDGTEITPRARTMQALVQVIQVVAQLPNAISYGVAASITPGVAVLPDVEVPQTLGLVTKGPPSPDAQKLIVAVAKYGATMK